MRRILKSGAVVLFAGSRLLRVCLGPSAGAGRIAYCRTNTAFSTSEENPFNITSSWLEVCLKEKSYLPIFGVKGENITVLREPWEFYQTLKSKAAIANKRIVLASLYLGTGHLEQELVDTIHERTKKLAADSENFQVKILLEHTRGSRGIKNSRTMLLPLLQNFPDNVEISLYHTPKLRGLLRALVPERFNETISAMHLKVYIFDDTLVMSGANLSNDYFTNRQDRCIIFEDCKELCDYFHELVNTVSSFSLRLSTDDTTHVHEDFPEHPYEGNKKRYIAAARNKMEEFLQRYAKQGNVTEELYRKLAAQKQQTESNFSNEIVDLCNDESVMKLNRQSESNTKYEGETCRKHETKATTKRGDQACTIHEVERSTKYEAKTSPVNKKEGDIEHTTRVNTIHEVEGSTEHEAKKNSKHEADEKTDTKHDSTNDTFVVPLIQMYPLDIKDDEQITSNFFHYAPSQSKIFLATAYFNLTSNYWNRILQSHCNHVDIVMAHPKANGFFEAPGMAGGIPHAYTLIAKQCYNDIVKFKQQDRIRFWEYLRPNWTFHGKGLWAQIGNENTPYITMVGSSNFGNRSAYRDLEAQALVITANEHLSKQLDKEKDNLMDHSMPVDSRTYRENNRKIPLWVFLIRTFMKTFF